MKKALSFLTVMLFTGVAFAQTYNTAIHMVPGGAELVAESGGTITVKSGGALSLESGSTLTNAATATNSGVQTFTGNAYFGAANYKSTHTAATGAWDITGALSAATVNTGQGANELYDMNQNVQTTDAVVFATVDTGQGANELYDMDQNVLTTASPTFASMSLTGNLAIAGSAALTANTDYSAVEVSTSIDAAGMSFLVINGTGTLSLTSTPHIATTTAVSGQFLTIMGGTNPVTFGDNDTVSDSLMELGDTGRALGAGDILRLIYYDGKWREIGFVNN